MKEHNRFLIKPHAQRKVTDCFQDVCQSKTTMFPKLRLITENKISKSILTNFII